VVVGAHCFRQLRMCRTRHSCAAAPGPQMATAPLRQARGEHGAGVDVVVAAVVVAMPHRRRQRRKYVERHSEAVEDTPHTRNECASHKIMLHGRRVVVVVVAMPQRTKQAS
jgi:hypothetical protein